MEVLEAIQKRRTVRVPFNGKKVPQEDLNTLIEISKLSPSGDPVNWRLEIVEDDTTKSKLAQVVKQHFGDPFQRNGKKFKEVFSQYPRWLRFSEAKDGILLNNAPKPARYFFHIAFGKTFGPLFGRLGLMNSEVNSYCKNITSAPLVIGVFLDSRIEFGPSGIPSIWNVGSMLQNMRLAATGLGLCYQDLGWITATESGANKARQLLNVPEIYTAINFFRIGHADSTDRQSKKSDFRRDLKDIVHLGKFGNKDFTIAPTKRTNTDILGAIRGGKGEKISSDPISTRLTYILEAARWAPTGFNVQPFEFIILSQENSPTILILEDKERSDPDPGPCEALARGGILTNIRLAANALGADCEIEKVSAPQQAGIKTALSIPENYSIMGLVELKEDKMEEKNIKEIVKEGYGKIAKQGSSCCVPANSCCGTTDRAEDISKKVGYSEEELKAVPEGANLGLGCGNPVALASLKEGETVLDLGSGAGFDCFLAANKVGKNGKVIGVDMTPEMVENAKENSKKGNYQNVEFRIGEIEKMPVADQSVDVVMSNCVINLSPDKGKVFQEAFRVLKPGGRLMISDIVLLKELPDFINESVEAYIGCLSGAIMKAQYLQKIKAVGFQDVRTIEETTFPIDLMLNDPTAKTILQNLKVPSEKVRDLGNSVASIRVYGVKPIERS